MKLIGPLDSSSYMSAVSKLAHDLDRGAKNAQRAKALRLASLNVINACVIVSGENVGSSSTASAAPEVAACEDDGDGEGDGESDPERRRPGRPRNTRNAIPLTVEHFDRLPDSACIDIAALKAITGKSRATLYRWIDKGILPKPRKLGLTSNNVWAAGDIRRALSE